MSHQQYSFEPYITNSIATMHPLNLETRTVNPTVVRHMKLDNEDLYNRQTFLSVPNHSSNNQLRPFYHPSIIPPNSLLSRVKNINNDTLYMYNTSMPRISNTGGQIEKRNIVSSLHPPTQITTDYSRPKIDRDDIHVALNNDLRVNMRDAQTLTNTDRLFGNVAAHTRFYNTDTINTRSSDINNTFLYDFVTSTTKKSTASFDEAKATALNNIQNAFPISQGRGGIQTIGENTRAHDINNNKILNYIITAGPRTENKNITNQRVFDAPVNAFFEATRVPKTKNTTLQIQDYAFKSSTPYTDNKRDLQNIYGTGFWTYHKNTDLKPILVNGTEKASYAIGPKPPRKPLYKGFQIGENTTVQ